MLAKYANAGRTVWRQRLSLPPAQAMRLAALLDASTDERVRYYHYHHFNDNCATRIRDLLDRVTGGALSRSPGERRPSFREWLRGGAAGNWLLSAITELLGSSTDRATDSWSAMFLPSELRQTVARRLSAPAELVVQRAHPLPGGGARLGSLAFIALGLLLALVIVLGRGRRWTLVPTACVLGLVALLLDAVALASSFPELRQNELLLVFSVTDFALPWLSRRFLQMRLGLLGLIALLHLGPLTQPLAPLCIIALPLGAFLLARRRRLFGDSSGELRAYKSIMKQLLVVALLLLSPPVFSDSSVPAPPAKTGLDLATWKIPWVAACAQSLERAAGMLNSTGTFHDARVVRHWEGARPDFPLPGLRTVGKGNASFYVQVESISQPGDLLRLAEESARIDRRAVSDHPLAAAR